MALVSYSDSDASDSEQENVPQPPKDKKSAPSPAPNPQKPTGINNVPSIVDRSNPRKIRVALPEIKPESGADGDNQEEGPARKKPRIGGSGGGGGAFSGFNAILPAPKRNNVVASEGKTPGTARKVFGLKTGAEPGFSREADEEMRMEQADETIPKAGSLRTGSEPSGKQNGGEIKEEPKLKGNAMMFKPLSVGRNQKKKKPTAAAARGPVEAQPNGPEQPPKEEQHTTAESPAPQSKPKVSLFSLSTEEKPPTTPDTGKAPATSTEYQPLMYNATPDAPPAGPERPAPELVSEPTTSNSTSVQAPTLDDIANDLNLSRSERRQLLGRHDASSKSQVLHFNTDREYVANQEMLENADLAASQHNPVRAIAPGKHTLQQLVNAASTQRDALEESFATGRRNKKEAGAKYGW